MDAKQNHKRVLIVEDDVVLAQEWKEEIERALSCTVDISAHSVAAMPLLEKYTYDWFILDLFYKKHGNFEPIGGIRLIPVINKLMGPSRKAPIIAVTGHYYRDKQISTRDIMDSLGVEHILQKPIDIRELLERLVVEQE